MRLSLIATAEKVAEWIVKYNGTEVEFDTISEMVEDYLDNQYAGFYPPKNDELDEFLEYVDYLVSHAEVKVVLPKERL